MPAADKPNRGDHGCEHPCFYVLLVLLFSKNRLIKVVPLYALASIVSKADA